MKFHQLPGIESKFRTDAASQLKPFSVPIIGESVKLAGLVFKPPRTGYYYNTEYSKQRIVLHFTAGNLRSDMLALSRQDYHVSVPFVIARDGTIYQLFPSSGWSGHIGAGIGNQGTGNQQDKLSIGIEISNYGLLIPREGNLETIYSRVKDPKTGKISPIDLYCSQQEMDAFTKLATPFRDSLYFPSYTKEQVESTILLIRYLTARYNIPRQFLPATKRFTATNDVLNFRGIVSHVNYRPSGKWDIGPAFDWDNLVAGVQAASFSPKYQVTPRGLAKPLDEIGIAAVFAEDWPAGTERNLESEMEEATDNEGYNPNEYDAIPIKQKGVATSSTLYGLLVGINKYVDVRSLNGAVGDASRMEKYLNGRSDLNTKLQMLTNEQASKKNIVQAFVKHLSKAKEGDTVLFYYSGHGTQEEAASYWDETDAKLECLVCHDKGAKKGSDFLLADKEIRYLLNQVYQKTKAHIVLLIDSCHSGDNSRGALQKAQQSNGKVRSKFIVTQCPSGAFEPRSWDGFIFSKEINEPKKAIANIHKLLPEAPHVSLTACESNESAIERGAEGVFTKNLLQVLDAGSGNISYNSLYSRIAQTMRFVEQQTPKLYVPALATNLKDRGFLNAEIMPEIGMAELSYNDKKGWQLNKGAIHNVKFNASIAIYASGLTAAPVVGKIIQVFIDYCQVSTVAKLNPKKTYPVAVDGMLARTLLLELHNSHGSLDETSALIDAISREAGDYYRFEGRDGVNGKEADYALHVRNGDVIITRPGDRYRPLVKPLPLTNEKEASAIAQVLKHMARWQFIKELRNSDTEASFESFPLEISVKQQKGNTFKDLKINNDQAILDYSLSGQEYRCTFTVSAKNTSQTPLFVAALYLGYPFLSFEKFLQPTVSLLEPGKTLRLQMPDANDGLLINQLSAVTQQYNWPSAEEAIQWIVSEENFNVDGLAMDALEAPVTVDITKGLESARDIVTSKFALKKIKVKQWQTQLLQLSFKNPEYNVVHKEVLESMLQNEDTAEFAAGLYYDVVPDLQGQPTNLALKPSLKVPPDEKGIFSDLKLWLANKVETIIRKKLYNRLKNTSRLRIVAEGDSWFQYPILLKDTLDHLYKLYAIRSYAEAGDTLENYLKKREYLEGIDSENPVFFLVSGGGNDILGEQFRTFLNPKPTPGVTTPDRYLNQDFFKKISNLKAWYLTMFSELTSQYPGLQILTHSYDYVIPVDTDLTPKKTSWLGKYMIEKNIRPQEERQQLIKFMVDQFNQQLEAAVKESGKNVHYINVRGLVPANGWYDEIHPDNEHFSYVADKFVEVIEKLKKK